MAVPEFILELRKSIGHAPLVLIGITAVVVHEGKLLVGRRADTGHLTPITGIVDPGEEPATAAEREVLEEAGVVARATDLVYVHQMPRHKHANGDLADYLDIVFRCEYESGEPYPADGEMTEVFWRDLDDLEELSISMRARVRAAVQFTGTTRFDR